MLEVRIDVASLTRAKSGAVWGGVWLESELGAIPQAGWQDLVAGVLEHWGEQLILLRETPTVEFRFFDGPYGFVCERKGDVLSVVFWSRGPWKPPAKPMLVTYESFCFSYVNACRDLVAALHGKTPQSAQTGNLITLLNELRRSY